MKVKTQDLSKTLKGFSSRWIALSPKSMKVVAVQSKAGEAISEARKKGVLNPVLTRAPKDYGTYIL